MPNKYWKPDAPERLKREKHIVMDTSRWGQHYEKNEEEERRPRASQLLAREEVSARKALLGK